MTHCRISGFFFYLLVLLAMQGCELIKTEDEKIKEALIGKFYQEDLIDEDGFKFKNIKGEYFKDGKFWEQITIEIEDDESFETIDLTVKFSGDWSVKDKFIYNQYDYNSMTLEPEIFMVMKDELVEEIKTKNTPSKVIDYDAAKIIYEDSDGERYTMKKSY